jgi:hypothetical protein
MNVEYETIEDGIIVIRTLCNVAKVTVKLPHQSMEFNDWSMVDQPPQVKTP